MNPAIARRLAALSSCAFAALCLSACGGSGGAESQATPPPPAQPETPTVLRGVALGAAGVQVCLDENRNQRCDASEPAATGDAQGAFTLEGVLPSHLPGAAVMAAIPASGASAAYALQAPAAKAAVVSPLTTLVQSGVAQGKTLAQAEQDAADQLQVGVADLYANYTDGAVASRFYLNEAAISVTTHLTLGLPFVIAPPQDPASEYLVSRFTPNTAQSHEINYFWTQPTATGRGIARSFSMGVVVAGGQPAYVLANLLPFWRWSPGSGWAFQGAGSVELTRTIGSPATTRTNTAFRTLAAVTEVDVGGMALADVARQLLDTSKAGSVFSGLAPATLSGTLPAGAKLRWMRSRGVDTGGPAYDDRLPVSYRTSSLAALAAQYPIPGAPTEGNTASIGNAHGLFGCPSTVVDGRNVCLKESVRVAFGQDQAATYYLCDVTVPSLVVSNCGMAGVGTYALGSTDDGITPLMRFTGALAVVNTAAGTSRMLFQREGRLWPGLFLGPSSSTSASAYMNRVTFEAFASALGLPALGVPIEPSVHRGLWRLSYAGTGSADCPRTVIDALGRLSGLCTRADASTVVVSGTVSTDGTAAFAAGSGGAVFGGGFTASTGSASGTWQAAAGSGTWSATRR